MHVINTRDLKPNLLSTRRGKFNYYEGFSIKDKVYLKLLGELNAQIRVDLKRGTLSVWASEVDFKQIFRKRPLSWSPPYR
jgi:hypothetical protein